MPAPNFLAAETLPAAQLKLQTVHICTSGTRPTGFEGLEIYETDTDKGYVYNGSAWVQVFALGAWDTFVPTLTQSATVAKTDNRVRWTRSGRWIIYHATVTATAAGTANNAITLTLPVASVTVPVVGNTAIGSGSFLDASTTTSYIGTAVLLTTTTVAIFLGSGAVTNVVGGAGGGFTAALASGDVFSVAVQYEAAASS